MPTPSPKEHIPTVQIKGGDAPALEALKERVERLEMKLQRESAPEVRQEIVKEEIHSFLQGLQYTPSFASPPSTRDEVREIKKFPPNQQVGALIELVFEKGKGLQEAIAVARDLGNPAILDELHDTLVDRYYNILIEKGILKP